MNIQAYREYCLAKPGVTEDFPFDEKTLVFKVCGKMFALVDVDFFESVNLKCDPEKALELRASYPGIKPGYHMNKKHWNTVRSEADVPRSLVLALIDHSYERVVAGFSQKQRKALGLQGH